MQYTKRLSFVGAIAVVATLSACKGPGGPGGPGGDDQGGPPPFSSLDLNGDGKLTLDEFKQQKFPPGENAEEIFHSIDANGDGVVTRDELANHRPPAPPAR